MAKFTIKCLLAASLFFAGVLFGMQQANEGIKEVKGLDQLQRAEQALQTDNVGDGAQAASTVAEKRKRLEDIKTFNVYSAVGRAASSGITSLFQSGMKAAGALLEEFLG
ncbi:MAG TPA: DUF3679 domain-containing protein [Bacillales bacterium]|nr:DUF3679 domain-containing protein [Bacillales bacterium]